MILLIDNYDSFTHNLYQALSSLCSREVKVVRNDVMTLKEVESHDPEAIVLSPGPGRPEEAGMCIDLIRYFAPKVPILGVCLGHQAIGEAFGGQTIQAPRIVHGKPSLIYHRGSGILTKLPSPFSAGRYHSLTIDKETFPQSLIIEAETEEGIIMAIRHQKYPTFGVQFHPESILTPIGDEILKNFLRHVSAKCCII
jgi:anthranilate synthase component II